MQLRCLKEHIQLELVQINKTNIFFSIHSDTVGNSDSDNSEVCPFPVSGIGIYVLTTKNKKKGKKVG